MADSFFVGVVMRERSLIFRVLVFASLRRIFPVTAAGPVRFVLDQSLRFVERRLALMYLILSVKLLMFQLFR